MNNQDEVAANNFGYFSFSKLSPLLISLIFPLKNVLF